MDITPEIQAHFDAQFNKRFAEIQAKAEAKRVEDIAAVKAELAAQIAAKDTELAELAKKQAGGSKDNVDLTALQETVAALKADKIKNIELARKNQMLAAAAKFNAVNAEQAAILASPYLRSEDDGRLSVVNEKGEVRLNAEGKPMSSDEFMSEFLNGNPHLVRAAVNTGAGTKASTFGDNNTMDMLSKLPPIERINAVRRAGAK